VAELLISDPDFTLYVGDALEVLAGLPAESVHCVITSPPYWGLRDYGTEGQLGLEPTPEQYVQNKVAVFREVRRDLRKDGTCWLNIGDSYNQQTGKGWKPDKSSGNFPDADPGVVRNLRGTGIKPKDLVGIPWRLAFALQADGWYLRSDIIWSKPNPMPESVTDRPTKAHEYLFLLTRSARYFYDADAIRESAEWARWGDQTNGKHEGSGSAAGWIKPKPKQDLVGKRTYSGFNARWDASEADGSVSTGRNKRSVWEIATEPYPDAHFATFPQALVEPCVLAGTSERGCCPECGAPWERETNVRYEKAPGGSYGARSVHGKTEMGIRRGTTALYKIPETTGWRPSCQCGRHARLTSIARGEDRGVVPCTVLDPFIGSGTTALVARRLGRKTIGIELSPEYAKLAARRLQQLSLLAEPA
jgi:DNA modification methylase